MVPILWKNAGKKCQFFQLYILIRILEYVRWITDPDPALFGCDFQDANK
jgi:hypothetical protein